MTKRYAIGFAVVVDGKLTGDIHATRGGRKFETAKEARAAILKEPVSLFLLHVVCDMATMRVLDNNGPVTAGARFVWSEPSMQGDPLKAQPVRRSPPHA